MKSFTDKEKRRWDIIIDVNTIKRVRQLLNVNLLDVMSGELIISLSEDPVLFCDVLYSTCKPQADQLNVSDVEFGRSLGGGTILEEATIAFLGELVDFFPSAKRKLLTKALEKMEGIREKVFSEGVKQMEKLDIESLSQETKPTL